jgi:hypothetical protein
VREATWVVVLASSSNIHTPTICEELSSDEVWTGELSHPLIRTATRTVKIDSFMGTK